MESVKYFYTPALQVRSFNLICDGNGEVIETPPAFGGTFVKDLPRMVVCSLFDKDSKKMYFGSAVCSSKDDFSRKTAQKLSYERAKNNPQKVVQLDEMDNVASVSRFTVQLIMNGTCTNYV